MTPPTEFNPTPEQVEEKARTMHCICRTVMGKYWLERTDEERNGWLRLAHKTLTELHRETETLRAQVEALKGQVVVSRAALEYYARQGEDGWEDGQIVVIGDDEGTRAKQALAQLSPK